MPRKKIPAKKSRKARIVVSRLRAGDAQRHDFTYEPALKNLDDPLASEDKEADRPDLP